MKLSEIDKQTCMVHYMIGDLLGSLSLNFNGHPINHPRVLYRAKAIAAITSLHLKTGVFSWIRHGKTYQFHRISSQEAKLQQCLVHAPKLPIHAAGGAKIKMGLLAICPQALN
jgi:hypothetical protein